MNSNRTTVLQTSDQSGPIIYWMIRDQRAEDNWALLRAQEVAKQQEQPLAVVMTLRKDLSDHHGTERMFDFMIRGMEETASKLADRDIPFTVLIGNPVEELTSFIEKHGVETVICDFSPLNVFENWHRSLAKNAKCTVEIVDAHNVVPCWVASDKQEYAARTIRPKIHKKLDEYLVEFPAIETQSRSFDIDGFSKKDFEALRKQIKVDHTVPAVDWLHPGTDAAHAMLQTFIDEKLEGYDEDRNDPNKDALSNMSPYMHFGQIAPQRVALEVQQADAPQEDIDAYLEELIIRRELSDNFCYYNNDYDNMNCFPTWAKQTLAVHADDEREYIYSLDEFEKAETHEDLWNAAQRELIHTGKMHGYMRMYWAKKILEWSESPAEAMRIAIHLNDRYELDGRDPNGYVGVAWSIGGVHDRGWTEREVYGKIRYMNRNGAKRKFDIAAYISKFSNAGQQDLFDKTSG